MISQSQLLIFYGQWLYIAPALKQLVSKISYHHRLIDIILKNKVQLVPHLIFHSVEGIQGQLISHRLEQIDNFLHWCRSLAIQKIAAIPKMKIIVCNKNHNLSLSKRLPNKYPNGLYQCDKCNIQKRIDSRGISRCPLCQYDLCPECCFMYY